MNRKQLAQKWTKNLFNKGKHFVIAIDGAWGSGKTFFAKNWQEMLRHDGFNVCYIDAFKYDFTDDAFMVISSEIINTLSLEEAEKFSDKVGHMIQIMKNKDFISSISSGFLSLITNGIMNKDSIQASIEACKNYNDYNPFSNSKLFHEYNKSIEDFKTFIKDKIKDNNKPLIIMIDELDRCRPVFAIECLEKIKHIFDIDNIVFILFINEDELSKAVQGVYGENYDGKYYLSKFYQLKLHINNENTIKQIIGRNQRFDTFISDMLQKLGTNIYQNPYQEQAIIDLFNKLNCMYAFTLRDIEYILQPLKFMNLSNELICGIFVLLKIIQIKDNSLFNQIMKKEDIDLKKYFKNINIDNLYYMNRLVEIYDAWLDKEQQPCNNYNDGSDKAVLSREYGSVNNFFRMLEQRILFIQYDE
ncbi:KAP family P-loop NTPase fold protein [Mucispirillum schaedleri]|uniref:KAP family P-loop NTPase fold protein n=1 Tax=Mucispirillum schaedleri TaxID=248039 RepID=UPI001F56CD9B|nr:P-loop NTPase fold protein [Mucispirillum schaedleri]